jgi:hypothetical protein
MGRLRNDVDDGEQFVHGCVPHWGKEVTIRMRSVIEHELTWAYYRMRRHAEHPLRKEVGDTLPNTAVSENMRFGKKNRFKFWLDLRPPFTVLKVKRMVTAHDSAHPDGDLYKVTYQCGIEYANERMADGGENGTFNQRITGVAQIRMSGSFPKKRPMRIITWGQPALNGDPKDSDEDEEAEPERAKAKGVDPAKWMPIGNEIGKRSDDPSMAACRTATMELTKKMANARRQVEVPELQKLLLGPHASLPRLAQCERAARERPALGAPGSTSASASGEKEKGGASPPASAGPSQQVAKPARRQHCIWTQAAGFIRYAG